MRVLVVATWFPSKANPHSGIFNLRDVELLARDHDVTVVHLASVPLSADIDDIPALKNRSFSLIRIPFAPSQPLHFARVHRAVMSLAKDFDLVHTMAFSALLPFLFRRRPRVWVHTEHWSGMTELNPSFRGRVSRAVILRVLMTRPDMFVVVSKLLQSLVARVRHRPISVISNFVSLPKHVDDSPIESPVRLVAVGALIERKGPLIAVGAVRHLIDSGIPAHLTWIGDGEQRSEVEQLVHDLGLQDAVTLAGPQPASAIEGFLKVSDLFVLPTLSETFCVAIAEAIANGLPVVTGTNGGFVEFLDPASSRLVADRTPSGFGSAIADLLASSKRPSRSAIAALAAQAFDEEKRREQYAKVYSKALAH